ncbi:MAG: GDSL-type esterase/lipase family protein [Gemmatimonadota bacterium]|nr:GDSL-type esterase/lipase family protein [Gemmatimonadota bacterium]
MEDIRINFIGDSFVNGTGDSEFLGWPGRVCAASKSEDIGITCSNLGVRADTSTDVLRRWEMEVDARRLKPHDTRIVFGFGANDCWIEEGRTRVERTDTISNTTAILSRAASLYPTLMIGPPPALDEAEDRRRQEMSALLGDLSNHAGVSYLSVIDALRHGGVWAMEQQQGDAIHPSAGGYGALALLVLEWSEWWFHPEI